MVAALVAVWAVVLVWLLGRGSGRREVHPMNEMSQAEAAQAAERGEVVVYWRPGCPYCGRLERALGDLKDRAVFVDIWKDADAAAYVRSVNDGNEVVPTVVMNGIAVTNPNPKIVVAALQRED